MLKAELFGYERGAFTDARDRKFGLVEAADGGPCFWMKSANLTLPFKSSY
jgi:two-component system response regulator AtoC